MARKPAKPAEADAGPALTAGARDPVTPAFYQYADAAALQAVAKGVANEGQQRRALSWIVEVCADTYGLSYRGDKTHDTSFAEGKRAVGLQIVKLTKINLGPLREAEERRAKAASSKE